MYSINNFLFIDCLNIELQIHTYHHQQWYLILILSDINYTSLFQGKLENQYLKIEYGHVRLKENVTSIPRIL